MTTRVIGFCGPEGAGKSSAAQIVASNYGGLILPFAEPLKRMVLALGVEERHVFGTQDDKLQPLPLFGGKTARHVMQILGTQFGRELIDEGFWVRAWRARFGHADSGLVVSDDLRFANEAAAVRDLGGVVICVVRSMNDFARKPKHASEDFAAIPHDWVLINDGTLEALHTKLSVLLGSNGELPRFIASAAMPMPTLLAPQATAMRPPKAGTLLSALNDSFQRNAHKLGFLPLNT